MKMKKASKIMALVLAVAMIIALMPVMMVSAADPGLLIGAITMSEPVGGVLTFKVPYTATDVDQVTVLAVIGSSTDTIAPAATDANIAYIDQQVSTTTIVIGTTPETGFEFKVDTNRFTTTNTKIFIKIGGSAIGNAIDGETKTYAPPVVGVSVTGYVQTYSAGATITITKASDSIVVGTTTTGVDGLFTLTAIAPNDYNLVITAKSALTRTIPVTVAALPVEVSTSTHKIDLMFGDINNSGKIEINDIAIIKGLFNKVLNVDATYDASADLNDSGKIEINDLALVKGLFNKTATNYDTWVK